MILTKEEFAKMFGYASERSLYKLLKNGKINVNKDGLIDTEKNKSFCKKRKEQLEKQKDKKSTKNKTTEKPTHQLALEIDMLNSKLDERRSRAELLQLKIAKEKGTVIETSVLKDVIKFVFEDMIKTLTEFPNIYAKDIENIVRAEEQPREILVEFLTTKVTESIKLGLNNAKIAATKYFKE